jgi:hypothetical protein
MSNNKFESLLELLINEENDKAEALFHEIVVEKSRDIYENLADEEVTAEAMHDKKMKKEDEVEETSEESKDEQVDEVVEIEDEATESETTEEESIEEIGGDATDELIKDISAEEEGEMDADHGEEMPADMDADNGDEDDVEDRVVDLEDALDELKAEFEAMMGKKDDSDMDDNMDMDKEESLEPTPEVEMEAKHMDKKKEDMKEYKNPVKADHADGSDKSAKSPVNTSVKSAGGTTANIAKGGAEEKGRPAPTAAKMAGDFENTGGKAKSTSFKKQEKAITADGSDKSAKSPVASK